METSKYQGGIKRERSLSYEIRDPVYGYITFDETDKKIIDTYPVQRLHRIAQLATALVAYPGATHTRFEHSVGAMQVSTIMATSLQERGLDQHDLQLVRFAGLLHDLGHGPFSHSFEYALGRRLHMNHEEITERLITQTEVADGIKAAGCEPREVAEVARGRRRLLSDLVAGQVDADKIDFLLRDSLHAGVEYGHFDWQRLIRSFVVKEGGVFASTNSLYSLDSFLIARFQMFRAVYYHKTVRAANLMLERSIDEFWDQIGLPSFNVEDYLALDDYSLMATLKQAAKERPESIGSRLVNGLLRRDLLKMAYEKPILGGKEAMVSRTLELELDLEKLSGIDRSEIFVDSPYLPVIPLSQSMRRQIEVWDERTAQLLPLSSLSSVSAQLSGYYEALRIYTFKNNKDKVAQAAQKALEEGFELHY